MAQAGNSSAFEDLVARRIDRLYATASLILHDRALGEDAVQNALVRAWRSLPGLRDPERFEPWLQRLLVHACIDLARSARHHRSTSEIPATLADRRDFEAALADRDAVERAFATLSHDHRAAFVLRHYLGHPVAEVAEALGIPLGTAKSRLHYAERAMAAAMEADARWAPEGGVS